MRILSVGAILAFTVLAAGCGGGSSTPASPTTVTGAAATGAIVTGTVQSGATGIAASNGSAAASLTVEVLGTQLSATTGPLGQFTLSGVPAGSVELRFRGPGTDARLAIGQLSNGETVTIVVSVTGSNAVLRTDDRSGNGEVRVSGTVERLTGTASAFTFFVGTRQIRGGSDTQFSGQGPSSAGFANLRSGADVEVRGSLSGDVLVAARVQLRGNDDDDADDDDDGEDDEDEFEGRITSMTGNAPILTLVVGGRTVVTSAATIVRRRGDVVGFTALQVQQLVEVEGPPRPGGGVTAEKITIEDDDDDDDNDDDDDDDEVRVEGSISGLSSVASCPAISFTVAGQSIVTTGATRFDISCSGLSNGTRVEVRGDRQPSGTVRATRVKRD